MEEVNIIKSKIESYKTEAEKIISPYQSEIIENIPEGYCNSYAVSEFITYIRSGQATKKKELISIYENRMHQQRLEKSQADMLKEQKQIKTISAITATASVLGLFKRTGKSYWDK